MLWPVSTSLAFYDYSSHYISRRQLLVDKCNRCLQQSVILRGKKLTRVAIQRENVKLVLNEYTQKGSFAYLESSDEYSSLAMKGYIHTGLRVHGTIRNKGVSALFRESVRTKDVHRRENHTVNTLEQLSQLAIIT